MLEYRLSKIPMSDEGHVKMDVYVDGAGPIAFFAVRSVLLVASASDVQAKMRAFEELYQGVRS